MYIKEQKGIDRMKYESPDLERAIARLDEIETTIGKVKIARNCFLLGSASFILCTAINGSPVVANSLDVGDVLASGSAVLYGIAGYMHQKQINQLNEEKTNIEQKFIKR